MTDPLDLPEGWRWATMGEIAKVVGGSTPKTGESSYWGAEIPWITPDDLSGFTAKYIERGRRNITQAGYDSCSTQMVPAGTVLFTSRAPIGYVAIAANPVCTNQGFKSFVCGADVRPEYVYWYLKGSTGLARSHASGTTFLELSAKSAARLPIPVPPLEVQREIIKRIEEALPKVASGRQSLAHARMRIEQFRAATLQQVWSGTLVGASRPSAEPGPDAGLPSDWTWQTLPQLMGTDGVFKDGDWVESKDQDPLGDVRLIQLADIGDGRYMNKSNRFLTSAKAAELRCTFLSEGDILIARMPDPLGRACIFPGDAKSSVTAVDVCILRPGTDGALDRWLVMALNSPAFRRAVAALESGSTRKRISRMNLATIPIPTPPRTVQEDLATEAERRLSYLEQLRSAVAAADHRSKALSSQVLRGALDGTSLLEVA